MRIEVGLWLAGAGILLVGGLLRPWPYRGEPIDRPRLFGLIVPVAAVCLGLICVVAGLVWRASTLGTWPGSTQADAMAMLASGTLVALLWDLIADLRSSAHQGGDPWRGHGIPESLAMFAVCLLLLLTAGSAWASSGAIISFPGAPWLFGVRGILASIGLGGWLCALADHVWNLRPQSSESSWESARLGSGAAAMRFSYPWLTAAWLVAVIWSLAIYVTLWRGQPAELWLSVAWLLGGIYLCAIWGLPRSDHANEAGPTPRLQRWALALLAAFGTAAAFMATIWTPFLLP